MNKDDFKIINFKPIQKPVSEFNKYEYHNTPELRYAIADKDGKVLDDAQGYEYKTKQKAFLALNWKFLNGKQKSDKCLRRLGRYFYQRPRLSFIPE